MARILQDTISQGKSAGEEATHSRSNGLRCLGQDLNPGVPDLNLVLFQPHHTSAINGVLRIRLNNYSSIHEMQVSFSAHVDTVKVILITWFNKHSCCWTVGGGWRWKKFSLPAILSFCSYFVFLQFHLLIHKMPQHCGNVFL